MSQIAYLCSIAVLAALILVRERQHNQIVRALIDRLLTRSGMEPLPEFVPLIDMTEKEEQTEHPNMAIVRKALERRRKAVSFNIPGAPLSGMGEVRK